MGYVPREQRSRTSKILYESQGQHSKIDDPLLTRATPANYLNLLTHRSYYAPFHRPSSIDHVIFGRRNRGSF